MPLAPLIFYLFVSKLSLSKPQAWLCIFLTVQLTLWTIAPLLVPYVPALDAIEMHSWSLSPEWGYYKHPPLPAWIIAITTAIFGKTQFALTLPSTASIALTYWAIWRLARQTLPPKAAVITTFFSATTFFYHIWATGFNHNIAQIPLWAWTITLLYEVLTDARVGIFTWCRLGVIFAGAFLAKYTAILLLPAFFLLWLTPSYRAKIHFHLLFAAILACAAILTPHILWLIHHDFQPLHYASARLAEGHQDSIQHTPFFCWNAHWGRQLAGFIGTLLLAYCIPIALLSERFIRSRSHRKNTDTEHRSSHFVSTVSHTTVLQRRFLTIVTLTPLVLALLLGLSGQTLAPMWGMAMLPTLPLLLVHRYIYRRNETPQTHTADAFIEFFYRRSWLYAWIIFQLLCLGAFLFKGSTLYQQLSTRSVRANYPAQALTTAITEKWQAQFPNQRLSYIAGPLWDAGVVSFYAKDTPMVLPDGDFTTTPWITLEQVRKCGIVLIQPSTLTLAQFPSAQIQAPLKLPMLQDKPPLTLKWALVPPTSPNECRRP